MERSIIDLSLVFALKPRIREIELKAMLSGEFLKHQCDSKECDPVTTLPQPTTTAATTPTTPTPTRSVHPIWSSVLYFGLFVFMAITIKIGPPQPTRIYMYKLAESCGLIGSAIGEGAGNIVNSIFSIVLSLGLYVLILLIPIAAMFAIGAYITRLPHMLLRLVVNMAITANIGAVLYLGYEVSALTAILVALGYFVIQTFNVEWPIAIKIVP